LFERKSEMANLKYAIRFMRRSPSFSAAVILTLALGIGGNTAVFSAINAVLLRPLPFPDADRLMVLHEYKTRLKTPESFVAPVRLEDWNRLTTAFQAISGFYLENATDISGSLPEKVKRALVAPRFLQAMGVSPALCRDFSAEEERFGGPAYGVSAADGITYFSVALLVLAVAALASLFPALRAARLEPLEVLREE
jgi:putative ABC transport system permease protein